MTDLATFLADTEHMRSEFTALTDTAPEPSVAESLVVLRATGSLVLPALRAAITTDPCALIDALNGPITALVSTASQASLPRTILWGNVASVIASAAVIVADEFPQQCDQITALATEALHTPSLSGAWTGAIGANFRRTTCCQVTTRDEGHCGDCIRVTRR